MFLTERKATEAYLDAMLMLCRDRNGVEKVSSLVDREVGPDVMGAVDLPCMAAAGNVAGLGIGD